MRALRQAGVFLALLACNEDLSLPPVTTTTPGGGCTQDSDCSKGICNVDHVCDPNGCRSDAQCQYGLCSAQNECNPFLCQTDGNCQSGHCESGVCLSSDCQLDSDCDGGMVCQSEDGLLECVLGCHQSSQCSGCGTCQGGDDGGLGHCTVGAGPPLSGTPTALRMTDNLSAAVSYVRQLNPGAHLTQIDGSELKSDGTVDITKDYTSEWLYAFQVADGGSEMLTVTYFLSGGTRCGYYAANAGNVSPRQAVPDGQWSAFEDATELVTKFVAHTGCQPLNQMFEDSILYEEQSGAPVFILSNSDSQSWVDGNPVTGDGGLFDCP
jgi:hypothetical protein